jgi:hypothetical protein
MLSSRIARRSRAADETTVHRRVAARLDFQLVETLVTSRFSGEMDSAPY